MPTNANTFNSRVTSEALEAKFREVFPSQGGAELPQDLFASGVLQPVVDFSSVAEGSVLPQNLQTAWDFSTGSARINNTTTTLVNNSGFWLVDCVFTTDTGLVQRTADIVINDGTSNKRVFEVVSAITGTDNPTYAVEQRFVVFLRSGDSLIGQTTGANAYMSVWYRQIADVNGTLVNPLGFTFS